MLINFSNTNSVWASVLVETLYRLGLTTAIVCPGSRSAPLAVAFAQHQHIEAIPVLDERSAAFLALGTARQTGRPTALICTSGTAGANFFAAVIEARESRVPLLVLTADRPPELRACNAGQAIDQQKLYGNFPNWYSELAVPALELPLLSYLRQTMIHAWERTLSPVPGVVHLNLPFRDPLAPVPQPEAAEFAAQFFAVQAPEDFFNVVEGAGVKSQGWENSSIPSAWYEPQGLIIAGPAQPRSPKAYCEAIAHLSKILGLPVLAEGLSPLRNYADLNPYLISTYALILHDAQFANKLKPDWVIRVGEMPTSKELRQWLARSQPRQWIIDPGDRNLDPLHGRSTHLRLSIEQLIEQLGVTSPTISVKPNRYLELWCETEQKVRGAIDQTLSPVQNLFEGKVSWLLSQHLPAKTPLFIANSMPIRDVEWFWKPNNLGIQPFFNRGANGIDGTLSTALGIAHHQQNSVLLTGDLALLHDTNGFLLRNRLAGHLTIVLINNSGGGIFEMLPIAQFEPPFEEFFATPQAIAFPQLCATYGVEHRLIQSWEQLLQQLNPLNPSADQGIRVLEIRSDRKADVRSRQTYLQLAKATLSFEF